MYRSLPLRLLGVLTLGLALAACDSNEDDAEAFLGTWTAGETTSRLLATTSSPQQTFDRNRPGQGGLAVTGDVTGSIRYYYLGGEDAERFLLSSSPARNPESPFLGLTLSSASASLFYEDENGTQGYETDAPVAYTYEDGTLTVDDLTLTSLGDGGTVTVDGALTFATISVPANRETEIDFFTFSLDEPIEIEFRDGGVLRVHDLGADTTLTGSWERDGDELRLILPVEDEPGETETTVASYHVDGSTMTLSVFGDACEGEDEEACLADYESEYGLDEGSLTHLRFAEVLTLHRSDAIGRPAEARPLSGRSFREEAGRAWPHLFDVLRPGRD